MPFTPAQQSAIAAGNRELLVSAAAGSGKTAVLVRRILRMIEQDGLSIDRMLIVTFTRAAAGEMRERLENALYEAAEGDERLTRQADLVATAQISTIHSFCQKTVRTHFQHCQIDPQFGLCDERMRRAFWDESMEETLDWMYQSAQTDGDLQSLTVKFSERSIREMLEKLHRFLMSRPDPMEWLKRNDHHEWDVETLDQEPMAQEFCHESMLLIEGMMSLWRQARDIAFMPGFPEKLMATVLSDGETLRSLQRACKQGMTLLMQVADDLKFVRMATVKPQTSDEIALVEQFKTLRSRYKDMVDDLIKLLPQDVEAAIADLKAMAPATSGLAKGVTYLNQAFAQRKRERAVIDFNDLEHMTLSILKDEQLRQELSQQFDAIFVDEYQDVSELQEAILNGLKRPTGQYVFYVGDVKQSIYRFRLAEPGLFLGKLSRFSPDEDAPQRRISLNRNFRSKTTVLQTVNRIFEHVMDSRVTEIDYDEDAHLVPGIPSVDDPNAELHILNSDGLRPQDQLLSQAEWIANDIQRHVGHPILDHEGKPCGILRYSDIAILLPVTKNVADKVEMALQRAGVPVFCEGANDVMASDEIDQVLHYLIALDNLMNDVSLLSVLRSPLFEMSESELAAIRMGRPEREASYFMALIHASTAASEPLRSRCRHIVDTFERERFYLRSMPLGDYLWDFLTRSGLYVHYGAQPGGKLKQANLRLLCHRASDWDETHTEGLHGFVETLMMETSSPETAPTVITSKENVVRVMTIHKSKGLEFPTVYVMNLERGLFGKANTSNLAVNGDVGFALGYVNEEARTKRPTLLTSAIAMRNQNAERAERARVLYVALTRPKSRLVMLGSDTLESVQGKMNCSTDVYAVSQAGSMLDWIVQCLSHYELSTDESWITADPQGLSTVSTGFPHKNAHFEVVFHTCPSAFDPKSSKTAIPSIEIPPIDMDTAVEKAAEPLPPPLKVGVTALCRAIEEGENALDDTEETAELKRWPLQSAQPKMLASLPRLPAFMEPPKEERALQVGVLTHRVLGLMRLDAFRGVENAKAVYAIVCREVERLQEMGVLTEQEQSYVNRGMIATFLQSDLGRRMLASPLAEREWSFNLRITQPFATMVQGVIDLCFLEDGAWVLVDFKTDRVERAADLWPRYHRQIGFYRRALECGTPYPVKEAVLFSLRLGEEARQQE